ncbi:hypothetical protein B0O79_0717 [Flavobacteriaceae bacterium MAR_2009_75]|nr:hypothetical protein B0O79_0717 [Flavobacteriaceae bacterium MAR_2009_75]
MRKISLVLAVAMLLSTGSVLANDLKPKKSGKSLSSQISEMLSENSFTINETDLRAQVRFTLNNEQEIVVLSIDADDEILEDFVKAKLNYKKVELEDYQEGKLYTVGVRIKR